MAVTLDTSGNGNAASGAGISITIGNHSNRVLVVCIQLNTNETLSSVTFDGNAMTQLGTVSPVGNSETGKFYTFYILAPTIGAHNLAITSSPGSHTQYASWYSFYNAAQSAPAHNESTSGTTTKTASLTATGGEWAVGFATSGYTLPTGFSLTGDASQNQFSLNLWMSGDSNGTVAAGSRTAVANYSSGTSEVAAMLVLVSPDGTVYTQTYTETVTLIDTVVRSTSRTLSETLTLIDTIIRSVSRTVTETITAVDTFLGERVIPAVLTETIALTDTIVRSIGAVRTETVTLTDTLIRSTQRTLAETITAVDTFTRVLGKTLLLTETITLVDTVLKVLNGSSTIWSKFTKSATATWTKITKAGQ